MDREVKEKCDEVDIEYMTSPYDKKSVDQVEAYVNAYKIGSGDIQWTDMLSYIAQKKKTSYPGDRGVIYSGCTKSIPDYTTV